MSKFKLHFFNSKIFFISQKLDFKLKKIFQQHKNVETEKIKETFQFVI